MQQAVRLLTVGGLAAALCLAPMPTSVTASSQAVYTEIGSCTEDGPRPCVASVLRNAAPLDADWRFVAWKSGEPGINQEIRFTAMGPDGQDLGFESLADTWEVTLETGSIVPRMVGGFGQGAVVERGLIAADEHSVTVSAHPVTLSGQCDVANYCPEWAEYPDRANNNQWDGLFDFSVYNAEGWLKDDQLDSTYGVNYFHNVATTTIPPEVRRDETTGAEYLWVELANRHYYEDGTTVVKGAIELRIPNQFLRLVYGVPDPSSMNSTSINPTVSGPAAGAGNVSVSQEAGGDAMLVTITDMTFSRRVARFKRGVIVPTRPSKVTATRVRPTRASVTFKHSTSRGAKVTGYQTRCRAEGVPTVVGSSRRSPGVVSDLRRGQAYQCQARARSKAGPGPWSRVARLARRS